MENVLIALLVLFNMWMVLYLIHEKDGTDGTDSREDTDTEKERKPDIMGRSLFMMPPKEPQAATSNESEAVEVKDVTFADGNAGEQAAGLPARIPDERLDETFTTVTLDKAGAAYANGEEEDEPHPEAGGLSFEDIGKAVDTLKNPEPTEEEIRHAGNVLSEMEGNELFERLTKSPELAGRVRMVLALCLKNEVMSPEAMREAERTASPKTASEVPDDFGAFNALDYL